MTTGSTNRKKPSQSARQAATRIRNTKAELLDTIAAQHKTIVRQTVAMAMLRIGDDANELKVLRLKMVLVLRRQLEQRLRQAIGDVFAFFEAPRPSGYVPAEILRIAEIREIAK